MSAPAASSALEVFLVEDSPLNVELASDLLTMKGHRVTVAEDGAAFRALLRGALTPSVVLMDILLPDASGVALLAELKREPRMAQVPVIAVTAQALAGDTARLLVEGFAAVITKPIDTRGFVREIERVAMTSKADIR